ncbi:MAG: amino acid permease [Acidobacteriota bacterium]|jgi:amino acid transporter|nr:amino acid permease [Acidobacteriota bacterium]NLT32006.1 amino acid permease [Acidobacteriota bacterium]
MKATEKKSGFGTAPVYFTAISTIIGAIVFLRFGFAVGTLGFCGTLLLIIMGHAVTIPTALAISELATNKRVEGGGEYFIISRSFGLNIGATIGIALYLSQAISVAFYIIAFAESFEFLFNFVTRQFSIILPRQVISLPAIVVLGMMILRKGSATGVKMLYAVNAILFVSLLLFFLGKPTEGSLATSQLPLWDMRNMGDFFMVFAICFPAFTGVTAGVGLSGDLKNPARSIPLGTILATLTGMVVYILLIWKLAVSASPEELLSDQLIMGKIAIGGAVIIPLGLAASTLTSALGSLMVAPRTLQALAKDTSFPSTRLNTWLAESRSHDGEPANATLVTLLLASVFVALGNVNAVAEIISMFFLVSYGSLCLISFLNHFGSSPSYRPSFRSKWYLSLMGFVIAVIVMFKINTPYALAASLLIVIIYSCINHYHGDRAGLESLFANTLFQISRKLQVYLQKSGSRQKEKEWRPGVICISKDSFKRERAFRLLNWLSYSYGFGTYLHRIDGYYSRTTSQQATEELAKLIELYETSHNHVYVDTIISPSYTSAIVQAIQVPGISGMENNMVVFEYDKENPENLPEIIDNIRLIKAGNFDMCLLASASREIVCSRGIHVWIDFNEPENASLLILLSFIVLGHPDWKKSFIKVFSTCKPGQFEETRRELEALITAGRLPITEKNVEIIEIIHESSVKNLINEKSATAAMVMTGFRPEALRQNGEVVLGGYDEAGTILFVNSQYQKEII